MHNIVDIDELIKFFNYHLNSSSIKALVIVNIMQEIIDILSVTLVFGVCSA